ncbi:hypothetical protein FBR06_09590 [Betaproteobacteria bacterium PRO4]|uniref:hypothetical protein n=1 Tax=Nitrosomonas sp. TaxID=42353 RepID=UPI002562D5F1|nr:hypothetical protein [Nitrosomonas sp.]MDL1867466.1 hypothetical protein [Betaproteobacteria bacterium PRO4]
MGDIAMLALLSLLTQTLFVAVVVYFALYVLLELRILLISNKAERRKLTELEWSLLEPVQNFLSKRARNAR